MRGARRLGTIAAFEVDSDAGGYLSTIAPRLMAFCQQRGVLIRPLADTVYVMPPYCISDADLGAVYDAVAEFIE
ncbi:hypothetical protein ACFO0A_14880 [Novosphingobium tardum]|uniref:Adenosylmethionine-8-amino-7-oxononanoate aminotransferase n=1 Tax=Novosphingobium tardum TaxID=1538021 RepID=A0ABV8RSG0_9SPHN